MLSVLGPEELPGSGQWAATTGRRAFNGRRVTGTIPKAWTIDPVSTSSARKGEGDCPVSTPKSQEQGMGVTDTEAQGRGLQEILFKILI